MSRDPTVSSTEALGVLLRRLRDFDFELAEEAQAAIDRGRDEVSDERRGRTSIKVRRTVPLTPAEALRRSIEVLHAHFVEAPLIGNAAIYEVTRTPLGPPAEEKGTGAGHYDTFTNQVLVELVGPASSDIRAVADEQVVQPLQPTPQAEIDEIEILVNDLAGLLLETGDAHPR
jgi:hypothetical protein